ncbi:MAG: Flp pilus assembly protein CpaB, partial [Steroidobacteraceae bacterium]
MRRPVVFVLLAGFAALVAALVVYSALHKRELEVQQATLKSEDVVVAAHDLPVGSKIDASAVKLVRWSRESIPPGAFTDAAAPLNRFTRTDFVQNEPLVADRLFDGDKNAGVLPLLIPKGMRAMSVAVDEVSDIAGFVMPHAHVDVLVSMTSGGAAGNQAFSKIVLQNVEVLAVAQQVENSGADKPEIARVVTLLVDPNDAERLALASHEGALRLAMRNYTDQKIIATRGVDVAQMLRPDGSARAGGIGDAGEKPVQIQIMRDGKSVENVDFVRGEGGAMKARSAKSLAAANAGPVLEPPAKMSGIDAAPASGLA